MVTFDHRERGTDESVWAASAVLDGVARIPELPEHLVVLAAHPDDDTLGAGGLMATAAVAGTDVTVVFASDGEGSHPGSPTCAPGTSHGCGARKQCVPSARLRRMPGPCTWGSPTDSSATTSTPSPLRSHRSSEPAGNRR